MECGGQQLLPAANHSCPPHPQSPLFSFCSSASAVPLPQSTRPTSSFLPPLVSKTAEAQHRKPSNGDFDNHGHNGLRRATVVARRKSSMPAPPAVPAVPLPQSSFRSQPDPPPPSSLLSSPKPRKRNRGSSPTGTSITTGTMECGGQQLLPAANHLCPPQPQSPLSSFRRSASAVNPTPTHSPVGSPPFLPSRRSPLPAP
jgi:hypothetical protein